VLSGARPEIGYPAQLKPPCEPHLLLDELVAPDVAIPKDAMVEIFLWVSLLSQVGQAGVRSASEKRTIFSNASPQSLQTYS
jgi:hypothetical protein